MRKFNDLLFAFLFSLILAGCAAAQEVSLASVPAGEKYRSTEWGYTIVLPAKPDVTAPINTDSTHGEMLTWNFKEGEIDVKCSSYSDGTSFATEADRRKFLAGYKNSLNNNDNVESLTEAPYSVGSFSGSTFSMIFRGLKVQMNVFVFGNKYYGITTLANDPAAGFDAPIFKAAKTFEMTTGPK